MCRCVLHRYALTYGRAAVGVCNTGNRKANGVITFYDLSTVRPLISYWWSFFMKCYRLRHLVIACCCCISITALITYQKECPKCPECIQKHCNNYVKSYFSPGHDCENNIIEHISRSNQIDVAVYSITNRNITKALIAAHKRGAKIRIITDRTQAGGKYSLVDTLKKAGLTVRTHRGYKIEHNKFAIFDNTYVVTGSYNWTTGATKHNSENCIFLDQPTQTYQDRFEYLWKKYDR